jgi:hypothetical protein
MVKYTGFMPRIEEFTWRFDEGEEAVFVTVRVVPLVPDGKFTVAPAEGKLKVEAEDDETSVPVLLLLLRAKATPASGEVVR